MSGPSSLSVPTGLFFFIIIIYLFLVSNTRETTGDSPTTINIPLNELGCHSFQVQPLIGTQSLSGSGCLLPLLQGRQALWAKFSHAPVWDFCIASHFPSLVRSSLPLFCPGCSFQNHFLRASVVLLGSYKSFPISHSPLPARSIFSFNFPAQHGCLTSSTGWPPSCMMYDLIKCHSDRICCSLSICCFPAGKFIWSMVSSGLHRAGVWSLASNFAVPQHRAGLPSGSALPQ